MNLIDTHCHLNFKAFDEDFLEVAKRSQEKGVDKVIIVGSDPETSQKALNRAREINKLLPGFAFCAVGIHPIHTDRIDWLKIEKMANDPLVVAFGETGLDFYHDSERKTERAQKELFSKFIELAIEKDKSLIIHNRLADSEVKSVIDNYPNLKKAVFHCFGTDFHFASWAIEKGFLISFTGNITYGNKKLKKVIERTPLEKIMIETDSPYITPEPARSEGNVNRNEPYLVAEVAKKIALIKNTRPERIADQTTANAIEFFNLN
jgi:TatD DNase family protein